MILCPVFFFLFKQKTAYERRISDWSSDVGSSDLDNCVGVMRNAGHEASLGASGTAFARGGTAVFAAGFYLGRDFSGGPASLVGTTGSDAVEVSSATGVISAIAVGSSALTSLCSRAVGSPVQIGRAHV